MTKQSTIPTLYRDTLTSPTDACPYCGRRHSHGIVDGHRVAHCGTILLPVGVDNSRGYYIKTREPITNSQEDKCHEYRS
jgi:hypothetical protein